MEKLLIKGINGSIEVNNNYLFLMIKGENNNLLMEHVVWFEEIENIIYKKPTRDKYGFITVYLSTKSSITKKKIKYTILLDKIDEKSLDSNKKIYDLIKSIIINKEIKIKEAVVIDNEEKEDINDIKEDINDEQIELSILVENKIEDKIENNIQKEIKIEDQIDFISPKEEPIIINTIENNIDEIIEKKKEINKEKINIEESKTFEEKKFKLIDINEEEIENDLIEESENIELFEDEELKEDIIEDEVEEIHEEIIDNNLKIKSINNLQKKILKLEKEIQIITFKEIALNRHFEDINDRAKLDKLIIDAPLFK